MSPVLQVLTYQLNLVVKWAVLYTNTSLLKKKVGSSQ